MNATTQSTLIAPPIVPFVRVPLYCGEKACAELSPVAFKVYYHIVRMTRGWQRDETAISYEEFKKACGLKSIGQISEALKELVSKGFIAVFKHTGPYGGNATSSYFLLDAAPKKTRAARPPWPAQSKQVWQPPRLERRTPPPARVSPPAAAKVFPPLGAVMSSAPFPPDPFEASEQVRARDIHAQLDQIELPCFQENEREDEEAYQREEEQNEEGKEAEEKDEPTPLSPLEELRRRLAALTKQAGDTYCLMRSSGYGTPEREERARRLIRIREDQQRVRALIHRLEAV